MYAPKMPEAWQIAEIERTRREQEWEGERASIPLPPPPPPSPARDPQERGGRTVIVIDLC